MRRLGRAHARHCRIASYYGCGLRRGGESADLVRREVDAATRQGETSRRTRSAVRVVLARATLRLARHPESPQRPRRWASKGHSIGAGEGDGASLPANGRDAPRPAASWPCSPSWPVATMQTTRSGWPRKLPSTAEAGGRASGMSTLDDLLRQGAVLGQKRPASSTVRGSSGTGRPSSNASGTTPRTAFVRNTFFPSSASRR